MTKDDLKEILRQEREQILGVTKEKKKRNFSKMIVTLVILMNVAFTIAILYVFFESTKRTKRIDSGTFWFYNSRIMGLIKN